MNITELETGSLWKEQPMKENGIIGMVPVEEQAIPTQWKWSGKKLVSKPSTSKII